MSAMKYTMKGSGVEWIGRIPAGWKVSAVKRHYSITLGKMLDSIPQTPDATLENYMCASNIKWGGIDLSVSRQMWFSASEKEEYLLKEGDLLVMEGGATAGTAAIYQGEFSPCYMQNSVNRCRSKNGNVTSFLYYWLYFVNHSGHIESVCNCATFKHLTKEKLGRLPLVQVPLSEQAAIAAYLDDKCGAIDDIITEAKAGIEEYKAWKASVIFEAVTKGLDPNAEMKDSGVEWIGQIPKGWSRDKITRIYRVIGSGTTPKFDEAKDNSGPINWILSGDVYSGGVITDVTNRISENFLSEYSALKLYQPPFVVIAMYGASIGNMAVSHVSGCVNQACCVLGRPREDFDFNYAYYALQALKRHLLSSAFGGGQPNVSQQIIKAQWLPMPPRSKQVAIAAYLDDKCSAIDSIIAEKEALIAELETYKKSLIFETVTGKRRVC